MNRYCWTYLHGWKVKPYTVWKLKFLRERNDEGNWQTILKKHAEEDWLSIPIADVNPPEYIIDFEYIKFKFIDDPALQFMEKIIPLLKDVTIRFDVKDWDNSQKDSVGRIMTMLAPKTNKITIYETDLSKFNKQYPGFIDGLQSIRFFISTEVVLDLTMELKWLIEPRKDGQFKTLEIYTEVPLSHIMKMGLFNDCVKEEFIHSTEPAKFIICIFNIIVHEEPIEVFEDFKIENETTGEILELKCDNEYREKYYLIRHKNDDEIPTKIDDLHEQLEVLKMEKIWIDID